MSDLDVFFVAFLRGPLFLRFKYSFCSFLKHVSVPTMYLCLGCAEIPDDMLRDTPPDHALPPPFTPPLLVDGLHAIGPPPLHGLLCHVLVSPTRREGAPVSSNLLSFPLFALRSTNFSSFCAKGWRNNWTLQVLRRAEGRGIYSLCVSPFFSFFSNSLAPPRKDFFFFGSQMRREEPGARVFVCQKRKSDGKNVAAFLRFGGLGLWFRMDILWCVSSIERP